MKPNCKCLECGLRNKCDLPWLEGRADPFAAAQKQYQKQLDFVARNKGWIEGCLHYLDQQMKQRQKK